MSFAIHLKLHRNISVVHFGNMRLDQSQASFQSTGLL